MSEIPGHDRLHNNLYMAVDQKLTEIALADVVKDNLLEAEHSLDAQLGEEYFKLRETIWHLFVAQRKRSKLGRLVSNSTGKIDTPLQIDYGSFSTPPLFEDMSADLEVPAKLGWAFSMDNPKRPVMDNIPSYKYLPVGILRTARDLGTDTITKNSWYSVMPGEVRKTLKQNKRGLLTFGYDVMIESPKFRNSIDWDQTPFEQMLEELEYEKETGEVHPAKAKRDEYAKIHALGLAQRANQVLARAF